MKYILGVDGGGSKTTVQISDLGGEKLLRVVCGASSYKSVGKEKAVENLNRGVLKAINNLENPEDVHFESSCFGFAGNDVSEDLRIYRRIVFNDRVKDYIDKKKTIICNDTRIGLEAGSDSKNRIVIIAGTGSNCLGINEEGKTAGASGWDYILADEGSGYGVGHKALKAIVRSYDGRGEKTVLTRVIMEKLKLDKVLDLTSWVYDAPFSKIKISALAKTVCSAALMGDNVSMKILTEEAEEASVSVITVAKKLGLENKRFDLVFVGGLFKCREYFRNTLINKLKKSLPKVNFVPGLVNPVEGAVKLAIKNLKVAKK
ncbi:MAG: BadF/BadG/BcrA/BcrD ATPase family protein [Actinomycetota bacterium]|nr:BadF/BadG/BcrA/BcrD ATPase family protein [Actinomycetota bacterium]